MAKPPYLLELRRIGEISLGYISVAEGADLPFAVRRVFWTYYTPESVIRGRHAHYDLEQILFAVAGRIRVTTEALSGEKGEFFLEKPHLGLYVPPLNWHAMQFSHNAVMLSLASTEYNEPDYIRDYAKFQQLQDLFQTEE